MHKGLVDISNEEYHGGCGISRSMIMSFKRSAYHYWYKHINPDYVKKPPSKEMMIGTALHTYLLEPAEFDKRYAIDVKFDMRTTIGKQKHAIATEKNSGKILLNNEDMNLIENMGNMINSDLNAKALIEGGQYEKSLYWNDPETGLLCKVRPDIIQNGFIVDYKSAANASYRSFQYAMRDEGYYMQFAMMKEAFKHTLNIEMNNFIFLVQEKSEPYLPVIYQLDIDSVNAGILEFHHILKQIKNCMDTNSWPGYPIQIMTLLNF